MPRVGLEHTIAVFERALDRAATVIGHEALYSLCYSRYRYLSS
jgi:hypothetical protein